MRLSAFSMFLVASICFAQPAAMTYPGISTVRASGAGGRMAWSAKANLVVYDRLSSNGYYDVHTMAPDGSNDVCLTCNVSQLPNKHKGNPDFDSTGQWIIFEAEKSSTLAAFDKLASPGSGLFNDVWMMDVKGTVFYQLTNVPTMNSGVLHPHISHSGTHITWAQFTDPNPLPLGTWEVQVADLVFNANVPSIQNIKTYQPGPMPRFYETHGFSPDDQSIYFTANPEPQQQWYGADIYRFTPSTGALINLTNTPNDWDEHADLSPDGSKILWVSSSGIQLITGNEKTDYWIMNVDGTGKRRLTWFNNPGFPESQSSPVAAARSAWSPDGSSFLGYLVTDNFGNQGPIVSVSVVAPSAEVSTASFRGGALAPDSIIALYSRNLSASIGVATSLPLPTTLGTTTVSMTDANQNTFQAPLYFVSGGQINYYVPAGMAIGNAVVSVYRDGYLVANGSVPVQSIAPAIFTANGNGSGVPAATYYQVSGGNVSLPLLVFNCASGPGSCTPAPIDLTIPNTQVVVALFGTGIRHRSSLAGVAATAGGQPLTVQFADSQNTLPGLDQVNLLIPPSLAGSGTVTVNLTVDGVAANQVQLAFK